MGLTNEDYIIILGSILGSPYLGKLPNGSSINSSDSLVVSVFHSVPIHKSGVLGLDCAMGFASGCQGSTNSVVLGRLNA